RGRDLYRHDGRAGGAVRPGLVPAAADGAGVRTGVPALPGLSGDPGRRPRGRGVRGAVPARAGGGAGRQLGAVAADGAAGRALYNVFQNQSGKAAVDELLSGGGMAKMLNIVWLVICAMCFGSVMERTGLLARIVRDVLG